VNLFAPHGLLELAVAGRNGIFLADEGRIVLFRNDAGDAPKGFPYV